MTDFAAIDFETANSCPSSVCSVGVVVVRSGRIVDSFYSLIRPEPDYYSRFTTAVHGLRWQDTARAELFPAVWARVAPMIEGLTLVAHNRAFDERCLRAAFRCYGMDYPEYPFLCTLVASRRALPGLADHRLDTVASACGYRMHDHHHALADAEACARIAMTLM